MNREDCEKLLDAYECLISLYDEYEMYPDSDALTAHDNLRDVIVGIMADEKAPLPYRPYTIPMDFLKPIVTYDGRGEITATTANCGNSKGE